MTRARLTAASQQQIGPPDGGPTRNL